MPADQRVESSGAVGVAAVGVVCPAGDVGVSGGRLGSCRPSRLRGIGGRLGGTGSSSAAGGRGHGSGGLGGTVEQAQSSRVEARAAVRGQGKLFIDLLLQGGICGDLRVQVERELVGVRGGRLQARQGVAVGSGLAGGVLALQGGKLGIFDGERYSAGQQGADHEASYGDRPPGHGARHHCAAPMHWRYSALRRVSRPGSTLPPA